MRPCALGGARQCPADARHRHHARPAGPAAAQGQDRRGRVRHPRPDRPVQAGAGQLLLHRGDAGCVVDADPGAAGLGLVHPGGTREPAEPAHRTQDRARAGDAAAGRYAAGADPAPAGGLGPDRGRRRRLREQRAHRRRGRALPRHRDEHPVPGRPGDGQSAHGRHPRRPDPAERVDHQDDLFVRAASERLQVRQREGPGGIRGRHDPQRAHAVVRRRGDRGRRGPPDRTGRPGRELGAARRHRDGQSGAATLPGRRGESAMNALRFRAGGLLLAAGILAGARAGDLGPSELDVRPAAIAAAVLPAAPGRATVSQAGSDNSASLLQTGLDNEAVVQQIGQRNAASIVQAGAGNRAGIDQQGTLNTARIEQYGQQGYARITQYGNGKSATIVQH